MSWLKRGGRRCVGECNPKKNLPFLRHTLHQTCSRHWSSVVTFPHPHIGQKGQKKRKKTTTTLPDIQQIPFTFWEPLITHTVPHICCSSGGARSSKLRSIERGGWKCATGNGGWIFHDRYSSVAGRGLEFHTLRWGLMSTAGGHGAGDTRWYALVVVVVTLNKQHGWSWSKLS